MGNKHSRFSDYVSSCGDVWVPINDYHNDQGWWFGYHGACYNFCDWVMTKNNGEPVVLKPGEKISHGVYQSPWGWKVATDDGKDPVSNTSPAYINFEINNKQDDEDHKINRDNCVMFLMRMADSDSECYGKDHHDTNGGTWQIENSQVSYHALGKKVDS